MLIAQKNVSPSLLTAVFTVLIGDAVDIGVATINFRQFVGLRPISFYCPYCLRVVSSSFFTVDDCAGLNVDITPLEQQHKC